MAWMGVMGISDRFWKEFQTHTYTHMYVNTHAYIHAYMMQVIGGPDAHHGLEGFSSPSGIAFSTCFKSESESSHHHAFSVSESSPSGRTLRACSKSESESTFLHQHACSKSESESTSLHQHACSKSESCSADGLSSSGSEFSLQQQPSYLAVADTGNSRIVVFELA
jgi:hypothetical protein